MIERVIRFSAENRYLVIAGDARAAGARVWADAEHPARRPPRPLRHPGHRLLEVGPQPGHHRGPGRPIPIITALLGAPKVKAIRGFSDFGFSYVYVIFEDGTDLYWARTRVLEYLSKITGQLPAGVKTELGPDATSVGWVFQYALVDRSGKHDLATSCAPTRTGSSATPCRACPASPRSRPWAGRCGSTR